MAWADFASLVAGTSPMTLQHFLDIRLALIERCDWIGDSTQKTAAQALSTTNPFNAAWINSARSIIEALIPQYVRPGISYAVSNKYGKWSVATAKNWMYNNLSGEPSGIGYSGGSYGWILRPTRKGTLVIGTTMPQNTYSPWLEHIMGLYYAIDQILRWLPSDNPTSSPEIFRWARKEVGYSYGTTAAAWAAMKADTPSISNSAGASGSDLGTLISQLFSNYNADDYRALFPVQLDNAWLVAPSAWDEITFLMHCEPFQTYLGPWTLLTNVTNSAAGAYSTGSAFKSSITLAAADTLEEFTVDNPDNHPKSTGTVYVMLYDPTYDGGDPGVHDHRLSMAASQNMNFAFKPTTNYGT